MGHKERRRITCKMVRSARFTSLQILGHSWSASFFMFFPIPIVRLAKYWGTDCLVSVHGLSLAVWHRLYARQPFLWYSRKRVLHSGRLVRWVVEQTVLALVSKQFASWKAWLPYRYRVLLASVVGNLVVKKNLHFL